MEIWNDPDGWARPFLDGFDSLKFQGWSNWGESDPPEPWDTPIGAEPRVDDGLFDGSVRLDARAAGSAVPGRTWRRRSDRGMLEEPAVAGTVRLVDPEKPRSQAATRASGGTPPCPYAGVFHRPDHAGVNAKVKMPNIQRQKNLSRRRISRRL